MVSKTSRSRVTNGFKYLDDCDGRSPVFRRYKDVSQLVMQDLGDPSPSEIQCQLSRRIGGLSVLAEQLESQLCRDGSLSVEEIATYTQLASVLSRIAAKLGIRKVPRDVTPSLEEYLATKQAERSA